MSIYVHPWEKGIEEFRNFTVRREAMNPHFVQVRVAHSEPGQTLQVRGRFFGRTHQEELFFLFTTHCSPLFFLNPEHENSNIYRRL